MNNIVANFDQIIEFASSYGLPANKKRAIVREYLQVKILDLIYREKLGLNLIFVGGTSLRLTRNLDRFSEDLDFDLQNVKPESLNELMRKVFRDLKNENIDLDLYSNKTQKRAYYEFRFKDLLSDLKLGTDPGEKLTIKFDFENFWHNHKKEVVLLNRYGYLVNVITIPLGQHLIQKMTAYMRRAQTQARDIYDIVWLASQNTKPDWEFARSNDITGAIVGQAIKKFAAEFKKLKNFKNRLKPFLIDERNVAKLDFAPELLEKIVA